MRHSRVVLHKCELILAKGFMHDSPIFYSHFYDMMQQSEMYARFALSRVLPNLSEFLTGYCNPAWCWLASTSYVPQSRRISLHCPKHREPLVERCSNQCSTSTNASLFFAAVAMSTAEKVIAPACACKLAGIMTN